MLGTTRVHKRDRRSIRTGLTLWLAVLSVLLLTAATPAAASDGPSVPPLPVCGDQDGSEAPLVSQCADLSHVHDLQVFRVPGAGPVDVRFDFVYREALYNNELGVFAVDDPTGAIGALHPGDRGYPAAVWGRAQVIFHSGSEPFYPDVTLHLNGGDYLVFFLVQNSNLAAVRVHNPKNRPGRTPLVFFSLDRLNPDRTDHFTAFTHAAQRYFQFGFEDLTGGGDRDFDDLVFNITPALLPTGLTVHKTADSATADAGTAGGYTISVGNTAPAPVTVDAISDTLPAGFTYQPGSTSGATAAEPAVAGHTLTWAGPFTVPAGGSLSLHFGVQVATTPGDYFNNATVLVSGVAVATTGDTARITVVIPACARAEPELTWLAPLDPAAPYDLPPGATLPVRFRWGTCTDFIRDESVRIVIRDPQQPDQPITGWAYAVDIAIDEAAAEYRVDFRSAEYNLTPGRSLAVDVYMGDQVVGRAWFRVAP